MLRLRSITIIYFLWIISSRIISQSSMDSLRYVIDHSDVADINNTISSYYINNQNALVDSKVKLSKTELDIEEEHTELKLGLILITLIGLIIAKLYQNINNKNQLINSALKDKDILLREIHHRVKNNLQVISSLLSLQSRQISDVHVQQAINEGRNRVRSMALIHQNLYQYENLTGVNVHHYLEKLIAELCNTYNINQNDIAMDLDIEDINLDVDTMVPLGLVINELISNCLKHAFPERNNATITICLREDHQRLILNVSDNGVGLEEDQFDSSKSFGNRLIKAFSQKLKADISYKVDNGTHITMIINNYLKAA